MPPWSLPAPLQMGVRSPLADGKLRLGSGFCSPQGGGFSPRGRLDSRPGRRERNRGHPPAGVLWACLSSFWPDTFSDSFFMGYFCVAPVGGKNAAGISKGCFISMVPPSNSGEQTEAERCRSRSVPRWLQLSPPLPWGGNRGGFEGATWPVTRRGPEGKGRTFGDEDGQPCAVPRASVSSPETWGEQQCSPPVFKNGTYRKDSVCAQRGPGQRVKEGDQGNKPRLEREPQAQLAGWRGSERGESSIRRDCSVFSKGGRGSSGFC